MTSMLMFAPFLVADSSEHGGWLCRAVNRPRHSMLKVKADGLMQLRESLRYGSLTERRVLGLVTLAYRFNQLKTILFLKWNAPTRHQAIGIIDSST